MSDREPPLRAVLDGATIVGKKWHPAVVYSLVADGPAGFSELERRLDISSKVLNETLADLAESGVVERRELQERPLRVEYAPTEAGSALSEVLLDLGRWSERYHADGVPVVLVVDDDARLTELYASMLEGYEVRAANDGNEGLAMVDDTVDVVLLDRKMPEIAGERVARRIAEEYPSVQVVLLASDRLDEAALTVPFDRYLRKPVTATGLTETVEDLLTPREETVRRYLSTLAKTAAFNGDRDIDAYQELVRRRDELADELQDPQGVAADAGLDAGE